MQESEGKSKKVSIEKARKSGFGIFKGMGPFTEEDEFRGQLEEND